MSSKTPRAKRTRADAAAAAVAADVPPTPAPAAAAAAAPSAASERSSKKSKRAERSFASESASMEVEPTPAAAPAPAPAAEASYSAQLLSALSSLTDADDSRDVIELAGELRTLQQCIVKSSTAHPADLLHPSLWPGFLTRLQLLQANSTRLDLHVLSALGRTATEVLASADPAMRELYAPLACLLQLLLPCPSTPLSESWAATFRPNYDFLQSFFAGLVRAALARDTKEVHEGFWSLLAVAATALETVSAAQNNQRRVLEQALQERNLPLWAELLRRIASLSADHPAFDAASECGARFEDLLQSLLFHAEHLDLYADALGAAREPGADAAEEEEEEGSEDEEQGEDAEADADAEMGEDADSKMKLDGEGENEPAQKKAKKVTSAEASDKAPTKPKPAANKPAPGVFVSRLFDAIAAWLRPAANNAADKKQTEDKGKKRKHEEAEGEAAAATASPLYNSDSIRSLLPVLFRCYMRASVAQFQTLYPLPVSTTVSGGELTSSSAGLSASDLRRRRVRERKRTAREVAFLQRMWLLNECGSGEASTLALPLQSSNVALLRSSLACNAALFGEVERFDLYKMHAEASGAGAAGMRAFRALLADQLDKVCAVVRAMLACRSNSKSATPAAAELLSLCQPLLSNLSAALQLNPEFLLRFLDAAEHLTGAERAATSEAQLNLWHFLWKVDQLAAQASEGRDALNATRGFAQQLLRAFFKLRQFQIVFFSFLNAARRAANVDPTLPVASFDSVSGSANAAGEDNSSSFDLDGLMRLIPPLKVPALWEWLLTLCDEAFSSSESQGEKKKASASSSASDAYTEALLGFFVYFLESMLVREEIAPQLDALVHRSLHNVVAPAFRALHSGGADSSLRMRPASLCLLLHALNEVASQVTQHVATTYDALLQPLAPYFASLYPKAGGADGDKEEPPSLTSFLSALSSRAATDAPLRHALDLLAVQRLGQVYAAEARALRPRNSTLLDEEDGEGSSVDPASAAAESEARDLASMLLERLDSCKCGSQCPRWDGRPTSLDAHSAPVALWHVLLAHIDALALYASPAQRVALADRLLSLSSCRSCRLSSGSASVRTLGSLSAALLSQAWFLEVAPLRAPLLDACLARLVDAAWQLRGTMGVGEKDAATAPAIPSLPAASFPRSAELAPKLATLRAMSHASDTSSSNGEGRSRSKKSASALAVQPLWEALWAAQLLHALPAPYVSSPAPFHASVLGACWALELQSAPAARDGELSFAQLAAQTDESDSVRGALCAHVFAACRRLSSSSVQALCSASSAPTALLAALFPASYAHWLCWSAEDAQLPIALRSNARTATRTALRAVAPALLVPRGVVGKKDAAEGEKKSAKKSQSADAPTAALQPLLDRLSSSLSSFTLSSDPWPLLLCATLCESFVPSLGGFLAGSGGVGDLARSLRASVRDAPAVLDVLATMGRAARKTLMPLLDDKDTATSSPAATAAVLELHARLLSCLAARMAASAFAAAAAAANGDKEKSKDEKDKSDAKDEDWRSLGDSDDAQKDLLPFLGRVSSLVFSTLAESSGATETRSASLLWLQTLCATSATLRPSSRWPAEQLSHEALLSGLVRALACAPSEPALHCCVLHLQSGASEAQATALVETALAALDPSFAHAPRAASKEEEEVESESSRAAQQSAALQLLQVFVTHAHSSAHRRALSHPRLSLLLYRLVALSGVWAVAARGDRSALRRLQGALTLLSQILTRPQLYPLDDAAGATLCHVLNVAASMLRDEAPASSDASSLPAVHMLAHPLYLCLYALVKHHASSASKLVLVFLPLLRALLAWQWRLVMRGLGSVRASEHVARVLEELARPANAKLFNKYFITLLVDWLLLRRSTERSRSVAQRGVVSHEAHLKAINKGWFAILTVCEEHESDYKHTSE